MQNPFPSNEWQRAMKELSETVSLMQPKVKIESFSRLSTSVSYIEPPALKDMKDSFAKISAFSASAITPEYCKAVAKALIVPPLDPQVVAQYTNALKDLAAISKPIVMPDYEKLLSSVCSTLRACSEYMTEDQVECAEAISPEILNPESPASTPRKCFTLADFIALLGLLISLYSCILQQLPDKQLEQLSAQNEIMIEQNSKQLELLQQLVDAGQEIVDFIEDNGDLFVGGEDSLVETDHVVLEIDDGAEAAADPPETEAGADSSNEQPDTDQN